MDAVSMAWDSSGHRWVLSGVTRRMFSGDKETLEQFTMLPAGPLHFNPDDLRKKQEKPDEMSYGSLKQFIENQRRAGQDVSQWLVDFYSKISYPFAAVIVVLFGVPFASVRRRGGTGVQLGISLLICFIYLIVMKVSQVFGYNGDVNPLLTAWAANLMFLAGAFVVILNVRKIGRRPQISNRICSTGTLTYPTPSGTVLNPSEAWALLYQVALRAASTALRMWLTSATVTNVVAWP